MITNKVNKKYYFLLSTPKNVKYIYINNIL